MIFIKNFFPDEKKLIYFIGKKIGHLNTLENQKVSIKSKNDKSTFGNKSGIIIYNGTIQKFGDIIYSNKYANKLFGYNDLKNINYKKLTINV